MGWFNHQPEEIMGKFQPTFTDDWHGSEPLISEVLRCQVMP